MNENFKALANKYYLTDLNIEDMNPNFEFMLKELVMECANLANDESREAILRYFAVTDDASSASKSEKVPFAD